MKKFSITCAIPYVNARPHIGHALEFIQADVIARYHRLLEEKVVLLSGADENALKNVLAAQEAGVDVQTFVDQHAQLFQELAEKLTVRFDVFQRGSDKEHHYPSSQKLWQLCSAQGDIYKQLYKGLYCVGCETFYAPDELDKNGECFEHPGKKLTPVEEENYFFRLSRYEKQLIDLIESDRLTIVPNTRKNEMLTFIKCGLTDISISRTNERAKNWGVPVPGDPTQRIYVWFDALNIYQSGVGFGWDDERYHKWWPADLHVIGKGILRFHAVFWPAFLLSAGLPLPRSLFVHDYITVEGKKMSKTIGNVLDPLPLIENYGADAVRYYLLAKLSPFSDGDFSKNKFTEVYTADLSNGLGNLVARVARLCELTQATIPPSGVYALDDHIAASIQRYQFNEALGFIWDKIRDLDKQIDSQRLWENPNQKVSSLTQVIQSLRHVGFDLKPFCPNVSGEILRRFEGPKVLVGPALFPRLDSSQTPAKRAHGS